ncbi:hypothetical protein ASPCADRAFT_406036 [Aspergillus carbonarius ITEM 5010]|uniref:Uncharacterized protein n=1 Tax=Aspergillus carbonarius (strain ITEM 5010) TaxID=602072 RepID=A0A1R3RL59_ASPC5|nr:hypothetical protein ASPCADRAFT_406036 [Aspergillus carbonarius ITEM 5010]
MAPKTWFTKAQTQPGTVIQLEKHTWVIKEKLNEINQQLDEEDIPIANGPGYACARFLVEKELPTTATPPIQAFMRTYLQVPIGGTEADPPATRARQATMEFYPRELEGLQRCTTSGVTPVLWDQKWERQGEEGVVPGGFILRIVWEIVPGMRLGDVYGSTVFWTLDEKKREVIRGNLNRRGGYQPAIASGKSLVWNSDTGTLYFVGFFDCIKARGDEQRWSPKWWVAWNLAKSPNPLWPGWDGSMEGWIW